MKENSPGVGGNHLTRERVRREQVYHLQNPPRVVIRKGGKAIFLPFQDIAWIEANGECTYFHTGNETFSINQGISDVENRLDTRHFIRIHRSFIVNITQIREIKAWLRGDYKVILRDGTQLNCSRVYKLRLDALLESLAR